MNDIEVCKASTLVKALNAFIEKNGDLSVILRDPDTGGEMAIGLDFDSHNSRFEITGDYHTSPSGHLKDGDYD